MVYIFTALYCEAQPLIQELGLIKNSSIHNFQVFCKEDASIVLAVTGAGRIAAAAAVGSLCTGYGIKGQDFIVNLGCCAGADTGKRGEMFLCNKITEAATGRTFYPDMLYRHRFLEEAVTTVDNPLNRKQEGHHLSCGGEYNLKQYSPGLYDMEAAGIYQAAAYFAGPHQISFLKCISDDGAGQEVTPKQVEQLMGEHTGAILEYISELQLLSENLENSNAFEPELTEWIDRVCGDMHCSVTMRAAFAQHIKYCRLAGIHYEKIVEAMYEAKELPCTSRQEGKKCFERFVGQLF